MTTNNRSEGNNPFHIPQETTTRSLSLPPTEMQAFTPTKRCYDDTDIPFFDQASTQNGSSRLNMNPALFLNPKGYGAPPPAVRQDAPSMSFNNSNNPTELEFQFTNPHDSFTPAGQPYHPNGHVVPPPNNFGDMMDRMNNVEQRMFIPQTKRRRLEVEDGNNPMGAFGNGGSGDIGQYVRERRQDAPDQQRPTQRVEAIDLTDAGQLLLQAGLDT